MNTISKLFVCEKCEKLLSTKQGLIRHSTICGIIKPTKLKPTFICDYCSTELASKQGLNKHTEICHVLKSEKEKIEKERLAKLEIENQALIEKERMALIEKANQSLMEKERLTLIEKEKQDLIEKKLIESSKTIQNLEFEVRVKDFELDHLRQYKSEKDLEITKLRQEKDLEISKLRQEYNDLQIRFSSIAKTVNIQNNNNITLSDFIKQDFVEAQLSKNLTYEYYLDGMNGIVNCIVKHVLNSKTSKYWCSDPSRHKFKFEDIYGNVISDPGALMLYKIVRNPIVDNFKLLKSELEENLRYITENKQHHLKEEAKKRVELMEYLLNGVIQQAFGVLGDTIFRDCLQAKCLKNIIGSVIGGGNENENESE
jgi:hypothetical protein